MFTSNTRSYASTYKNDSYQETIIIRFSNVALGLERYNFGNWIFLKSMKCTSASIHHTIFSYTFLNLQVELCLHGTTVNLSLVACDWYNPEVSETKLGGQSSYVVVPHLVKQLFSI